MFELVLNRLVELIVNAGIVLGFFLAFVFWRDMNRQRKANRILSLLLIILSLSIAHSHFLTPQIHIIVGIKEPFVLAIGPMLLFYFRESAGLQNVTRRDWVHFIPVFLYVLIFAPNSIVGPESSYGSFFARNSVMITTTAWILAVIQYAFYWWHVVHLYQKHRAMVESEFSNTEGKTLSWMRSFFHIFGMCVAILAITIPIALHSDASTVSTIINCTLSVTIFFLGYEGLFQEEVFKPAAADSEPELSAQDAADARKAAAEAKAMVPRLLDYMKEKKPHLNEALTLTELARQVGMTRNQLSAVINTGVGESFFDFINKYRVDEAKRLIADPKNSNFTILSLAFEAGFPSKSSFHNIFKKYTGLTPTAYRKTLPLS